MPRAARALCLAAALLAAAMPAQADRRAASDFHRRAVVEGEIAPGTAYAVPLSREAVAALEKGGELRLFDAAGREIPSLVHTAHARYDVVERPVAIFNRAWSEGGTQTLSVELTDRKPEAVNEFVFDLDEDDYDLRVRIEGSEDGADWKILGEGLRLIRHTVKEEDIRYRHDTLRIPTARFPFYRFTLQPMRRRADAAEARPLDVKGVAVRERVRRGSSLAVPVRLERFDDPRDDDPRHAYWKLHLDRAHLGVDRVALTIAATDFARRASLWEWSPERRRATRRLADTVLFRFGKDAHLELDGFSTDAETLVLRIDQGDDEPVELAAARASRPRQQLRFLPRGSITSPVALHLDPDEPRDPKYDLERALREHEVTSFSERTHGALEPNPLYAKPPEPRSERIPWLLYALVVPLVVGLGFYVARTIARGVPEEPPPTDP